MSTMPIAEDDFSSPGAFGSERPQQPEQAPEAPVVSQQPEEDPIIELMPKEPKLRRLGIERKDDKGNVVNSPIELWQRQLSFFGKWELTKFLAKAFNEMLRQEEGQISLWQFLAAIGVDTDENNPIEGALRLDVMIRGASRLAEVVPDFLEDLYCIVLNVPREMRDSVKRIMRYPVEEGGFDDDTGFDIMELAYSQNAAAFNDFFSRARSVFETGAKAFNAARRSSTP